jgi:hypothetical protein
MKTCQHLPTVTPLVLGFAFAVGFIANTAGGLTGFAAQATEDAPQTELAAQIRTQGFACDKPLSAAKDARRSQPDHAVWVLKCSNATYRVSRFPDMAAKVERLR